MVIHGFDSAVEGDRFEDDGYLPQYMVIFLVNLESEPPAVVGRFPLNGDCPSRLLSHGDSLWLGTL